MPSFFDAITLQTVELAVRRAGRTVLQRQSFRGESGQLWALFGANGAGKSTLLRCLAGDDGGLQRDGQVRLGDRELNHWPRRERAQTLAYLPQKPEMPHGLSVREAVLLGCAPRLSAFASPSAEDHAQADRALAALQLQHLAEREAAQLSGGEQQRVHLARIWLQRAAVWLLDEPYGGLDFAQQASLLQLFGQHVARGGLVVVVAHDLFYLPRAASHVALLRDGELLQAGPRAEVWTEAWAERAFGVPFERGADPAWLWPSQR